MSEMVSKSLNEHILASSTSKVRSESVKRSNYVHTFVCTTCGQADKWTY